jgi:hypothetical protein
MYTNKSQRDRSLKTEIMKGREILVPVSHRLSDALQLMTSLFYNIIIFLLPFIFKY